MSPLPLNAGTERRSIASSEDSCSYLPTAKEPFAQKKAIAVAPGLIEADAEHGGCQNIRLATDSWAKDGLESTQDIEGLPKQRPGSAPQATKLGRALRETSSLKVPKAQPKDGKECFLAALETLVGNRTAVESDLERFRQPLESMAEQLNSYFLKLHGAGVRPADVVEVLAQTRIALRQRNAELMQCDADLSKASSSLQRSQSESSEVKIKLEEARQEIAQKDAKLQRSELDLNTTRELLRRSRAETEKHIAEVMDIQTQLLPKQRQGNTSDAEASPHTDGTGGSGAAAEKDDAAKLKEQVTYWQEEASKLRRELRRLQSTAEKDCEDSSTFLRQLVASSSGPVVSRNLKIDRATVLGSGNYGYVLLCEEQDTCRPVVAKLHSQQWIDVAAREWTHAASVGAHPHMIAYKQVFVHRDDASDVAQRLDAGYLSGALSGRKPKQYPACYICITMEYMDRGTVKDLIARQLLTVESIAAVARQTAEALRFIHEQQRTHNDITPQRVFLQASPDGRGVLLVKLADFSLSEHSVERRRDYDLLAYLIWSMAMGKGKSSDAMPESVEDQARAVREMQAAAPAGLRNLWARLADTVDGLWKGDMSAASVAQAKPFAGRELRVPLGSEEALEAAGREHVMPFLEAANAWQAKWRVARQSHNKIGVGSELLLPHRTVGSIGSFSDSGLSTEMPGTSIRKRPDSGLSTGTLSGEQEFELSGSMFSHTH